MPTQQMTPYVRSDIDNHSSEKLNDSLKTPDVLVDRYRFIQKLGKGSQGSVYLAERLDDGVQVAVKELSIDTVESFKDFELFLREADVLASLSIDGVAKLYEGPDVKNGKLTSQYLIQEYIPGYTLNEYIKVKKMTPKDVYHFAIQMIDILNALLTHVPPIIHRDLKPSNIIMRDMGNGQVTPYVIDFGAVANPQKRENGSTVAGTYGYMPPEQYMGKSSPACDTYALAAILVYLLGGKKPEEMEVDDNLRLCIEPYLQNIPKSVIQTLNEMLDPRLDARLSDLCVIKERFSAFYQGKYSLVSKKTKSKDKSKTKSVHPVVAIIVIILALAGAGAYILYQLAPEVSQSVPAPTVSEHVSAEEVMENWLCVVGKWANAEPINQREVVINGYEFSYNDGYRGKSKEYIEEAIRTGKDVIVSARTIAMNNQPVKELAHFRVRFFYNYTDYYKLQLINEQKDSYFVRYSCSNNKLEMWNRDDKSDLVTYNRIYN